ncbi:MAG: class I SAM-dependent methyltransferase [candidate division Zixibacteria bacterium]|nr:class I SAM-dependent methyltransferase [candidate division Zixibacteria bacterium]
MAAYYSEKLAAERLLRVYEIAPPSVQQYLQAEMDFVTKYISHDDIVLELGCGYGRVIPALAEKAKSVYGIDTSIQSLQLGQKMLQDVSNCHLLNMDAVKLSFPDNIINVVVCIQNGISAFHVNQQDLVAESIRVTKPGGKALFSTYSDKFWDDRLEWFKRQADEGLVGEIDFEKTGNGVIVCKDGFRATTVSSDDFRKLVSGFNVNMEIVEVDESSLFCVIRKQ